MVNMCLERPLPGCDKKSGLAWPPQMASNKRAAFMGQMVLSVAPMQSVTPCWGYI